MNHSSNESMELMNCWHLDRKGRNLYVVVRYLKDLSRYSITSIHVTKKYPNNCSPLNFTTFGKKPVITTDCIFTMFLSAILDVIITYYLNLCCQFSYVARFNSHFILALNTKAQFNSFHSRHPSKMSVFILDCL